MSERKANKAKESRAKDNKPSGLKYPVEAKVNPYGFIHMRKKLLEDLGWHKGMTITIEKNEDSSITLQKAEIGKRK